MSGWPASKTVLMAPRIGAFAQTVIAALADPSFNGRRRLLRFIIDEVRITGWDVDIRLRIPR
jgi:hypothetical protein